MSTVDRPRTTALPPLVDGQRLDQPTFHERYEAMPPGTRAELVGGIVFLMPSPVSLEHARKNDAAVGWLLHYERFTPGVETNANLTTILDPKNEVQPDALLRIKPECGGQARVEGKFLGGAPELVLEVAVSTRSKDLGRKLREYELTGVLEYVVAVGDPNDLFWHVRREGRLVRVPPGADGLYRSESFPGLWLDPASLLSRDLNGLFFTLDRGLASPEHAEFVARLGRLRP